MELEVIQELLQEQEVPVVWEVKEELDLPLVRDRLEVMAELVAREDVLWAQLQVLLELVVLVELVAPLLVPETTMAVTVP